jgi:putative restriction endonuclease
MSSIPLSTGDFWHQALHDLGTWKRGAQRAVHKPLLTLMLLARAQRGEPRQVSYEEVRGPLLEALRNFGPPRKSHHPELPFWYLKNDGFWCIQNPEQLQRRRGKDQPTNKILLENKAMGEVPEDAWRQLLENPNLIVTLAQSLLETFWPETFHEDIASHLGLSMTTLTRKRDPKFREAVLVAYERQCAVCGFDGRLRDDLFGIEAAHIHFKQDYGPDIVQNGLALCSLHHRAFDRGAIGLSPQLQVVVSQDLVGHDMVKEFLVRFNGQELTGPQSGQLRPQPNFINWHLRNVFRGPARAA